MRPHSGKGSVQVVLGWSRVVHGPRRDDSQTLLLRKTEEHIVVHAIERITVVEELDDNVFGTEQLDEPIELCARIVPTPQRPSNRALATPREHEPVTTRPACEIVEVIDRAPLLRSAQLGFRDRGGESVIALLSACEHEQVLAFGVGDSVLRSAQPERQLGTENCGNAASAMRTIP
jgi:hypothetical protein